MISKELLSEVLGYEVTGLSHNGLTNGKIGKDFRLHINSKARADKPSCVIPKESINVYELAYKCKEWAAPLGFNVSSNLVTTMITSDKHRELFEADTEPEAIFKACEWILEKKDE